MKYPFLRKSYAFALASFCSILLAPGVVRAAAVTGDPLNIGTGNTFTAGSGSAVIGEGNALDYATDSTVIGYYNSIASSTYALVVGDQNSASGAMSGATIGEANLLSGSFNLSSGYLNTIAGWAGFAMGDMNELLNTDASVTAEATALTGRYSHGDNLIACLMAGTANQADYATDSAAIGHGLILGPGTESLVVVGQYNATAAAGARFIVANGSFEANVTIRSNALEVYDNGDVIIPKAQGDILMGEFGN